MAIHFDKVSLLTDFYELSMMNGYYEHGKDQTIGYFDYFFRSLPDGGGFAITCGLEQFIAYIKALSFDEEDLAFLAAKGVFSQAFLDKMETFHFSGDIWAMPEGTPVFPNEPIMIVRGNMFEAQLIETMLLLLMNHQSLICTKASRIVRAANGKAVLEFGARRAQGIDAAVLGARAAYIAGCVGSSNTLSDQMFGVPSSGTMAHSWVQLFDSEYEAFKAYAQTYADDAVLLVDTYDVMRSGLVNALKVHREVLQPMGKSLKGIRIDSGDIAYLSKKARAFLDQAGLRDTKIFVSNSLDEYLIRDMLHQGAAIDAYGVGERLITSKTSPVFGGVYKLVGVKQTDDTITPKIKLSENVEKITTPGFKQVWRLYRNGTDEALADVVTFHSEIIDDSKPYELFHPEFTWKRKTIKDFYARPLLVPIFKAGDCVYEQPSLEAIRAYCALQVQNLWDEVKRFENPHRYFVDLSPALWHLKTDMIQEVKEALNRLEEPK